MANLIDKITMEWPNGILKGDMHERRKLSRGGGGGGGGVSLTPALCRTAASVRFLYAAKPYCRLRIIDMDNGFFTLEWDVYISMPTSGCDRKI